MGQVEDTTEEILVLRENIKNADTEPSELYNKKFALEGESRALEAEVGPVKYIAELIYGDDTTRSMLILPVRFVMIIHVRLFLITLYLLFVYYIGRKECQAR